MRVGMRVDTQYGPGTVKGFERFNASGNSLPLSDEFDPANRIAVELDPGHSWAMKAEGERGYCYCFRREIQPSLRPLAEVLDRSSQCIDGRDFSRLMEFVPPEQWKEHGYSLQEGAVFTQKEWTRENVMEQFQKDVGFGFEKALDQRGISASLMAEVVGMWFFVLQDAKGLQVQQDQYAQYGLPIFKYAAVTYGFENPIGDDVGNEKKYACS